MKKSANFECAKLNFLVGNFSQRTGRNPQTGATLKMAAKKVPAFSAGKKFKELVK